MTGVIATSAAVPLVAAYDGESHGRMTGYQTSVGSAVGSAAPIG